MSRPRSLVADHPIRTEIAEADRVMGFGELAAAFDRDPAFPRSTYRELGRRGLLGLRTPTKWGGRGLPMPAAAAGLYELAYRGGTMLAKLSLQPDFSSVLAEWGSPRLREEYALPMARGEILVGNQITEPGAGSDVGAMSMRADRADGAFVLDGGKSQAAFALDADAAIVYARTGGEGESRGGITAFLVPQQLEGIDRTVSGDLGERWMRRGTVRYHGVRVPADHLIGEEGRALDYLKAELSRERLLLAAVYLGVGRSSFDEVVEYAGERETFGRPIRRHEAVGFPLVEDWAELDAAWLYVERAAERFESGEPVEAEAALAKWKATDVALRAIDHAIQFHGGAGYSSALPHERRWRDVRSGAIAHGPSEIMHLVAARTLWTARDRPPASGRS